MTTVYFMLSKAGIKNEMLKGISAKEKNSVDIDLSALTDENRKLLLSHSQVQFDWLNLGNYGAYRQRDSSYENSDGYRWNNDFYQLTSPDIISELKRIEAEQIVKTHEAEKNRLTEIEEAKIEEEKKKTIISENRKKILGNKEEALKLSIWNNKIYGYDADNETIDFVVQILKEQKEEAEKEAQANKIKAEKLKENLRQWALKNGSELLIMRIEENMNWHDLANTEYFASIMPDGFEFMDGPDKDWEIKNATLEQIKALREVKKSFPDAKLMRYKYDLQTDEEDCYENEEDRYEHKNVIVITLKSISGDERVFEKEL